MAPPSPPPPPADAARTATERNDEWRQRVRAGDTGTADAPVADDATALYAAEFGARAEVAERIASLAQDNPALRGVLEGALEDYRKEVAAAAGTGTGTGRRLFQRQVVDAALHTNRVDSELMAFGPIVGIDLAACGTLCEALRRDDRAVDANPDTECAAFAFRRLDPTDDTDAAVECHLLKSTGLCAPIDFAATLFSRKYASSEECSNPSAHSNPLCVELSAARGDARVMDYETSATLCRRGSDAAAGNGGKLPTPRSALEAMSMVGYARQAGVFSFWAQKPPLSRTTARNLHWADNDGNLLHYPVNETRCVLADTMPGHGSTHMFVRLAVRGAARRRLCEASQAAPAPPPGATGATGAHSHWRDLALPPPPAIRAKSIRTFVNTKVRPLTEAICTEATEGRSHRAVYFEMAEMLSEWRRGLRARRGGLLRARGVLALGAGASASTATAGATAACRVRRHAVPRVSALRVRGGAARRDPPAARQGVLAVPPPPPSPPSPPPQRPRRPSRCRRLTCRRSCSLRSRGAQQTGWPTASRSP